MILTIGASSNMDDKITIIEGPPPVFEDVHEGWVLGLNESPSLSNIAVTRLRTFNGPALVERCYQAWRQHQTIHLEFRSPDGLDQEAPIVAARHIEADDGQLLLLWVKLNDDEIKFEFGYEDDFDDDEDDDLGPSDIPF
jgi:hypothetical protein